MKHQGQPLSPGKSPLTQPSGPELGVGKMSRVQAELQSTPAGLGPSGPRLIVDGTQLESSLQRMVEAVTGRRPGPGSANPGTAPQVPPQAAVSGASVGSHAPPEVRAPGTYDDALDAQIEQLLAGLRQSLARMGQHLAEARNELTGSAPAASSAGNDDDVARPASPDVADGHKALDGLKASLERMRLALRLDPEPASPVELASPLRGPSPDDDSEHDESPARRSPVRQVREPVTSHPLMEDPPAEEDREPAVAPTRPPVATNQPRDPQREPPLGPPATATATPVARSYDVPKRVFKALSYGGAAIGTAASFAGWIASYWVGPKIQQTGQAAGGVAKILLGATGDYFDMKEKRRRRQVEGGGIQPPGEDEE